ncbi:type II CAAX prenyl endopeptidase Rce1 family protein [Kitasatospora sp. NPDC127116]|uniref:CPBP family glutamic-type intramembrane protease n=1 Tax=Kitasatospora sp. NPDC127116 TaxID=3345367 RepID=UPI003640C8DD
MTATTTPPHTRTKPATLRWLLLWGTLATTAYAAQIAELAYHLADHRIGAGPFAWIECAGVLAAATCTIRLRLTRGGTEAWRDPVVLTAAVLALCRLTVAAEDGSVAGDLLRLLLNPLVLALLAAELMRRVGAPVRFTRPTWRTAGLAVLSALCYLLALRAAAAVADLIAQYYPVPAPTAGFDAHDHVPAIALAAMSLALPLIEELVLTGALVTIGRQLRVPVPVLLAAAAAGRIALHAYLGAPGLASAVFAVAAVALYWDQRRLLPLVAAHVAWDLHALVLAPA